MGIKHFCLKRIPCWLIKAIYMIFPPILLEENKYFHVVAGKTTPLQLLRILY